MDELPDIPFVATSKARNTDSDCEQKVVKEKERDLGRLLSIPEEEYVKLQVKKDKIVKDFPAAKERPDNVKKQLQSVKNKIKKMKKILDKAGTDVCQILEVKKVAKSGAERKQQERNSQDKEARDRQREALRERMRANRTERTEEEHMGVRVEDRRRKSAKKADIDADPMDGLRSREILEGSFRVNVNNLDKMTNICQFCQAVRFKKETGGVCCLKGKVRLARFSAPPMVFLELWFKDNLKANVFRNNSRAFNNGLCFSSIKVKEKRFARYTPSIILQGKLYHLIGSLQATEGETPVFAQLYVHDPALQTTQRLANMHMPTNMTRAEKEVVPVILVELQEWLKAHNPFAKSFIQVVEYPEEQMADGRLVISAKRRPAGEHVRRYNQQTSFGEVRLNLSCLQLFV